MDVPFSVDIKNNKDLITILVSGELIINHIQKIKSVFLESLDFSKNLSIKVTNPTSIDITFIQLLCSIKKAFTDKGFEFNLEGTFSEDVYSLVSNAGFNDLFKL